MRSGKIRGAPNKNAECLPHRDKRRQKQKPSRIRPSPSADKHNAPFVVLGKLMPPNDAGFRLSRLGTMFSHPPRDSDTSLRAITNPRSLKIL